MNPPATPPSSPQISAATAANTMVPVLRLAKKVRIFDGFFGFFWVPVGAGYAPGTPYGD